MVWNKPKKECVSEYKWGYIGVVPELDLISVLENNKIKITELVEHLSSSKLEYRYDIGKWTIKEILLHIIDSERIFAYRVLCFLRGELKELPGYDENVYSENSFAINRSAESLIEEYKSVRAATITLLKSVDQSCVNNRGTANGTVSSVTELAYMIAGHEIHHLNVINTRYL